MTDADHNRAELTYDGHDRQLRWTFPAASGAKIANPNDYEEYGYDPNGNRTLLRKRDGAMLTYAYDALDRVTQKAVPTSATGAAAYTVAYGYDNRGLELSAAFAAGGGISNSYDAAGRLTSATTTMDGTARSLSYGYDADGNRTHLAASSGSVLDWTYDGAGAMNGLWVGSQLVQIGYDAAGRRQSLTMTNGGTSGVSYGYDAMGRLASLGHDLAGTDSDQSDQRHEAARAAGELPDGCATGSVALYRLHSLRCGAVGDGHDLARSDGAPQ